MVRQGNVTYSNYYNEFIIKVNKLNDGLAPNVNGTFKSQGYFTQAPDLFAFAEMDERERTGSVTHMGPTTIFLGYVPTENNPREPLSYLTCFDDQGRLHGISHCVARPRRRLSRSCRLWTAANRLACAFCLQSGRRADMSEVFNPEMLALAREARGLDQRDVTQRMSRPISQAKYSKIEGGLVQPSSGLGEELALALGFRLSFFFDDAMPRAMPVSYHRKRQKLTAKDLQAIHGRAEVLRLNMAKLLRSVK